MLGDATDDGQSQAAAGVAALLPVVEALQGLEDALARCRGNARAVIVDINEELRAAARDRHFDARAGIAQTVLDQVAERPIQLAGAGGKRDAGQEVREAMVVTVAGAELGDEAVARAHVRVAGIQDSVLDIVLRVGVGAGDLSDDERPLLGLSELNRRGARAECKEGARSINPHAASDSAASKRNSRVCARPAGESAVVHLRLTITAWGLRAVL